MSRNKLQLNQNQNRIIFIQEKISENVVCKMTAIIFLPPCTNEHRHDADRHVVSANDRCPIISWHAASQKRKGRQGDCPGRHWRRWSLCTFGGLCNFLSQNGALWDMVLVHCGICATGLLQGWYPQSIFCAYWYFAGKTIKLLAVDAAYWWLSARLQWLHS